MYRSRVTRCLFVVVVAVGALAAVDFDFYTHTRRGYAGLPPSCFEIYVIVIISIVRGIVVEKNRVCTCTRARACIDKRISFRRNIVK